MRSKSYTVKWVKLAPNDKLQWSIKPLKNSIQLAIYRHLDHQLTPPNSANGSAKGLESLKLDEVNQFSSKSIRRTNSAASTPSSSSSMNHFNMDAIANTGELKLENLESVANVGKCAGDEVKSGEFVSPNGGHYAFIFDNTFSKTKAKKIKFSYEQTKQDVSTTQKVHFDFGKTDEFTTSSVTVNGTQFIQGYMQKNKRKKTKTGKAFNKRFFSLNVNYAILDYYLNENSKNIRGNMLITSAVISASSSDMVIYLDSGMEQWILKAFTKHDFNLWVSAFNMIKKQNRQEQLQQQQQFSEGLTLTVPPATPHSDIASLEESIRYPRRWSSMNPKFNLINDKINSLKAQIDDAMASVPPPSSTPSRNESPVPRSVSQASTVSQMTQTGANGESLNRRSSFFAKLKKKNSSNSQLQDPGSPRHGSPSAFNSTTPPLAPINSDSSGLSVVKLSPHSQLTKLKRIRDTLNELEDIYYAIKHDEDARSESRKTLTRHSSMSCNTSINSSEYFYDAQEYIEELENCVVMINNDDSQTDFNEQEINGGQDDNEINQTIKFKPVESESSEDEEDDSSSSSIDGANSTMIVCNKDELPEWPYEGPAVQYRKDVPAATCDPPSIVSILRKGISKDLTSMAMPIGTNEPLSFMQKYCEAFEYTNLLNDIPSIATAEGKLLNVGIFAISYLSSYRLKIRCLRKPFNPLLSESYELIRPEMGLRVICEKVVHKPFKMACYAESKQFTLSHCLEPTQNFYGKSAELVMNGKLRMQTSDGDIYEWTQPSTALRNMIGFSSDKFNEPINELEVKCLTNGLKLKVKFVNESTRFTSNRSEKVELLINGTKVAYGKWTEKIFDINGKELWRVGRLPDKAEKKWGFTEFSCSLNEMDEIHSQCAPTDSRRRPDQRLYEQGNVDEAESIKLKLEQCQRERRETGQEPINFFHVTDDGNWEYIQGEKSYWKRRANSDWDDIVKLWS